MAESFMKTLKAEEVYINEYHTLTDTSTNIQHFIKIVYNTKRLHSSLGYHTPDETEADFHKTRFALATQETVSAQG